MVTLLVAIQAFRPKPNVSTPAPGKEDFVVKYGPPAPVAQILQTACYDCHSNNTRYPWYAQVQPVGWWLAKHIEAGKRALNFSEFGGYDVKRQAKRLDAIGDQMTEHEMPLRSYTWIHNPSSATHLEDRRFFGGDALEVIEEQGAIFPKVV